MAEDDSVLLMEGSDQEAHQYIATNHIFEWILSRWYLKDSLKWENI
jgi:hypothetical protein